MFTGVNMIIRSSLRLLTIGALLSTNLYAGSEAELQTAIVTDERGLQLDYKFNSVGNGKTCIGVVKIERIRDSIDYDTPIRVPAIRIADLVWDSGDIHVPDYDESLIGTPRKGNNKPTLADGGAGVLNTCTSLDHGSSTEAGADTNTFSGLFSKRNQGYLQTYSTHTVDISATTLALYNWSMDDTPLYSPTSVEYPTYIQLDPGEYDYTAQDSNGDYVSLDDSLVITTVILRRNNGNTQQYYHFESWVDLDTGIVTNLPVGMDMETWYYPGYDATYQKALPALITFNSENQPGCLAELDVSNNKYDCLYPVDGDIQDAFPTTNIGDISDTDNFRVLRCGSAEEDGIEISSGTYDVVSLETQNGITGYHNTSHWCIKADKAYRSWHNLVSITGQGWVASKDGMGDWWCVRDENNICKNSLIEDITIPDDNDLDAKMRLLFSPMAETSTTFCRYHDGTTSACSSNDNSAFDTDVTFDTLKSAFFQDAANLLNFEEPVQ